MNLDWPKLAETHPLLATLPASLQAEAGLRAFTAGDILFRRGRRPKAMLYVIQGEVRLIRHTAGGQQVILQRSRNGFVAEASLASKTYHCDAAAATDGHLLTLPIPIFQQALDADPTFRHVWIATLAGEVRRLRVQNERLHLNKAADRVLHYIEAEGKDGTLTLLHPRKAWAEELGLSHEALYRTLARLQEQGLIRIDGKRIALLQTPANKRTATAPKPE